MNTYCSKCGSPLFDDSGFCPNCGASVNRERPETPAGNAGYNNIPIPEYAEKSGSKSNNGFLTILVIILSILCITLFLTNRGLRSNNTSPGQEKITAIAESKRLKSDEISKWLKEHGSEYNAVKQYRASTNVVVVRVGETYDLEVTYVGQRYTWVHTTTNNCECDWDSRWSDFKSHLLITGVSEGTSEILFSLGDKNGADPHETFRVLVVVVP